MLKFKTGGNALFAFAILILNRTFINTAVPRIDKAVHYRNGSRQVHILTTALECGRSVEGETYPFPIFARQEQLLNAVNFRNLFVDNIKHSTSIKTTLRHFVKNR